MTTEREHARAHDKGDEDLDHAHRRGGRHKPSSEMTAPEHPVTSGLIARKADGNGVHDGAEDAVARASGSSGVSLPGTVMRKFESSLGADLSGVRVHTGGESQAAAGAVGAKAYTVGQDIHFGAGQYDPSSGAGEHLLAHEVAHTVQQQGGTPTRQNKLAVSTPFDAAEHEADSAADAMVTGRSASVTSAGGVQRRGYADEQAAEVHSSVDPSYSFTIPLANHTWPLGKWAELKLSGSIGGKISAPEEEDAEGGETKAKAHELSVSNDKDGASVGTEVEVVKFNLLDIKSWGLKSKPALIVEANSDGVELKVGGLLQVENSKESWLHVSGVVNFVIAGVKWKELREILKNPKAGIEWPELKGDLTFSGERDFAGDAKISMNDKISFALGLNKEAILEEALKKGVQEGIKDAVDASGDLAAEGAGEEALEKDGAENATKQVGEAAVEDSVEVADVGADSVAAVDVSAVAAAAAPVVLIGLTAILVTLGSMQDAKNEDAQVAGVKAGNDIHDKIEYYVGGFYGTLNGLAMDGDGSAEAERQIAAVMSATGKDREGARKDLLYQSARKTPEQYRAELTKRMQDDAYYTALGRFKAQQDSKPKPGYLDKAWAYMSDDGEYDSFADGLRNVYRNDSFS